MSVDQKPIMRCAIYTRKSSEEGLEQSFNSLDAQREACDAFILSQKQEGWRALAARYDDGGYSGGSMERPALKRLLEDIEARRVNIIVVYKVDRLTRSLADFAKIVEALDARGVSFVSVTQQFNTTSSMGRLTLNILLSFAQFEREVTGERIRDKIAASKKKGMWMGGPVPLGYDLEGRKLIPSPKEAERVATIFSLYLKVGCVSKLAAQLDRDKVRSKAWTTRAGARLGGVRFARGALYALLRNRLYIGEIRHREHWYPGEHEGIVDKELWNKVQAQLDRNLETRCKRAREQASSLLTGLVADAAGNRFTPSFTIKRGRRYRYYVSQLVIKNPGAPNTATTRFPASELEEQVVGKIVAFLKSDGEVYDGLNADGERPALTGRLVTAAKELAARFPSLPADDLRDLIASFLEGVILQESNIEILLSRRELRRLLENDGKTVVDNLPGGRTPIDPNDLIRLTVEAKRKRCGGEIHLVVPPHSSASTPTPKPPLIKAVARAHGWYEKMLRGTTINMRSLARQAGLTERYVGKVFAFAFLAPEIVEAILEGRQPHDLTFAKLSQHIPLSWSDQRRQFGFPEIPSQTPRNNSL